MPQVLRTRQADVDLLEIWIYVAENDKDAADRVLDAIDRKCHAIAAMPGVGRERDELAPNLRSIPEGNYVIFYRPIKNGIQVIRLLHGARDIQGLFS